MIHFLNVTYRYPDTARPALRDVSFDLAEGTLALLVGPSGAGKSTLLRCLNGLVPHFSGGVLEGTLRVAGLDPVRVPPQQMARHVGFVFQDPEAQFVTDRVEDEVAFALENAALPRAEMRVRVEEALALLDLAPLRDRRLTTLSGGERQRVAIAAALALRPRLLVLDEPTSQLDPKSAEDVLHALTRLNHDLGLTVVLAEHRLERVVPFADDLLYLPGDAPGIRVGAPRDLLRDMELVPPLVAVGRALGWAPLPLTIKEGRRFSRLMDVPSTPSPDATPRAGPPVLEARDVTVRYGARTVLRGVGLDVHEGEIVVLMGRNGAGKTTLLRSLVGLVRPERGQVRVAGLRAGAHDVATLARHVGYLPQDPNALLFADTVRDELLVTLRNHGLLNGKAPVAPDALLDTLGLAAHADAYPRDLSAGERQRVALGAILVTRPSALLLDEPTRGLDYGAKQRLARLLRAWRDEGLALLLVTHDVELAAAVADRVVLLSEGEVIADGVPATVLGASPLFAPQVARLFPGTGWLTPEDVRHGVGKAIAGG